MLKRATLLALLAAPTLTSAQAAATAHAWLSLFNGRDLTGWTPKIRGYEAGDNYADTFRVERGRLTVSYEDYEGPFAERFGHLFYAEPFSHYRLRLEYRFTGTAAPGAPEWAIRNSGVMLHAQGPDTMLPLQDFPISIEFGAGFIALQSEGHPVQFRRIELLDLVGCMTAENARYAAHYVQHDPARCAND